MNTAQAEPRRQQEGRGNMKDARRIITDIHLQIQNLRGMAKNRECSEEGQIELEEQLDSARTCLRRAKAIMVRTKVRDIAPDEVGEEDPGLEGDS